MTLPKPLLGFLGKARGYVFTYILTMLFCGLLLWNLKLESSEFQAIIIGCFVALSAGGGIAAFRDGKHNGKKT
jgi:hypothetical protein